MQLDDRAAVNGADPPGYRETLDLAEIDVDRSDDR